MTSNTGMKLLYFDTWRRSPVPVAYPGCLIVQVLNACTPGGQGNIRGEAGRIEVFRNIIRRRRRVLKRAFRYFQSIGARRTLAKIRSNVLAYQSQVYQTVAAIAGVVVEAGDGDSASLGSRIAGYRTGHPVYADLTLVHPDQVAEIPAELSVENAATVFYYTLAFEAMNRLESISSSAIPVICGDTLPCLFLKQLFSDANREILWIRSPNDMRSSHGEDLINKGAQIVVGSQKWYDHLRKIVFKKDLYLMGLNADAFPVHEWNELRSNWIGLPHADACNVNIFSRLPLDLPSYLSCKGIREALLDMSRRHWSSSAFLKKYDVAEVTEGGQLSLNTSYRITNSNGVRPKGKIVVRKKTLSLKRNDTLRIGFIGLGMWARGNLISFLLKDRRVRIVMGVDQDLIRLQQAADLFDIPVISTDPADACSSEEVDAVFISTWHDSHAKLAAQALRSGKKVFVEKPLALNYAQLDVLLSAVTETRNKFLTVGFNRVHSGVTKIIRRELANSVGPITLTAIVREPTIPRTHYYYWPHQGSRVVSNGCHWIDYAFHLFLPRMPVDIRVISALEDEGGDNSSIIIRYGDGSLVTLSFADRGESLIGGE